MGTTFLISDTHWDHKNILTFKEKDGVTQIRPFASLDEMNEALVENWNRVVKPKDKVYHLGDVAINRSGLRFLARLNGDKVLIKGNHDIFKLKEYTPYFRDVRGSVKLDSCILTHIPVHPNQFYSFRFTHNIHGHLHQNRVLLDDGQLDTRYYSVCCEWINYTPIPWDVVRTQLGLAQTKG